MFKADKLIVLALFVCIISAQAQGQTVYFFVGEVEPFHNDGYVLALSNPSDIAHARDLIGYGWGIGRGLVVATVYRLPPGTCGVNRNYVVQGIPCWSWEVSFVSFADMTPEILDGWPGDVEGGWPTGSTIGFWSYTVVAELGTDLEPWNCDLSADGKINFSDLNIFAQRWRQSSLGGPDIDGSSMVDIYDVAVFADNWLSCFHIPAYATYPNPANNAINMGRQLKLRWSPTRDAISHDVYFGTNAVEIDSAEAADANLYMGSVDIAQWDINNYDINGLDYSKTYFWRIDEITPCETVKGVMWSFTTMDEPTTGPVGWWRFDEGGGVTTDDSAGTNNGTLMGNTSWGAGKIGPYALNFDGDNDYVVIPDNDNVLDISGQMTICAWIKPDASGFNVILNKGDAKGSFYPGNYQFYLVSGALRLSHETTIGSDYIAYTSSSSVSLGAWQHVAVTLVQNGNVNFYINGAAAGTVPQSGTFGVFNNEPIRIGIQNNGICDFDGAMDDIRIYNRALDAGDIFEIYQEAFPLKANNSTPVDGSAEVGRNVTLSWIAGRYAASHDIYFGTSFAEVNEGDTANPDVYMCNQISATWDTNNYSGGQLDYNTVYYWRIDEVNDSCVWKGDVWRFTTVPPPPEKATDPSPANSAENVAVTTDLGWTAGSGATSHDIYFGTTYPPSFCCNQSGIAYDTGTMDTNTIYYWRIDEKNPGGTITGDIWSFTTSVILPGQASNPIPTNESVIAGSATNLNWTDGSYTTSHNVYFGTANPPPFRGNQTGKTYNTGAMDSNTTYYWRIDEKNNSGITTGLLWSFTTSDPNIYNGVAAWWKFDEANGTIAYDFIGTSNGTIYGATWTTGKIAGALSFNGSSNYVNCGSGPSNYDNVTVSVWIKTSTYGPLVSNRYNSGSYGTWYTLFSNVIEIGDNTSGGYRYLTFNTTTLDDVWHHIVYTKNGTIHAIYVDGSLDQEFTSNADISRSQPLYIGKSLGVWFNGTIDDVRIYSRALSGEEILQIYQSGL